MLQKLPIDVTGRVAAVRAGIGAPRKDKPAQTPPFTHDPSATGAFDSLSEIEAPSVDGRAPKAVVIGGGTGAPMSIRTLLSMGAETSAVVAMADDGGSTGILRDEAGVTAPGDVRKCITAMAADPHDPLTAAFKLRFSFAENHTLGNLMLSSLEVTSRSFPEAIRICERILNARGHVYPSTLNRVNLVAKTRDGHMLEGQAVACHSPLVPFGETPETIYQLVYDQPRLAFRIQRPAYVTPSKLPSASHSLCPDVPVSVYSASANPVVEPPPTFVGIMMPRFGSVVSSVIYFQDAAV